MPNLKRLRVLICLSFILCDFNAERSSAGLDDDVLGLISDVTVSPLGTASDMAYTDTELSEVSPLLALFSPGTFTATTGAQIWTLGEITYTPGLLSKALGRAIGLIRDPGYIEDMTWIGRGTGTGLKNFGQELIKFGFYMSMPNYGYGWYFWEPYCPMCWWY